MSLLQTLRAHWLVSALSIALIGIAANEWRGMHIAAAADRPSAKPSNTLARSGSVYAEGRMAAYPDAEVTVSAYVSGCVTKLRVKEKAVVKAGELLGEIDVSEQQAALAEALARVKEADTSARYFQTELERSELLMGKAAVSRAEFELATFRRDQANAHRSALRASLSRLDTVLKNARVLAPIDGVVMERFVDQGETVAAGAPVLTVADLSKMRVEAEVVEFDAGRVKLGASATIHAEGFAGAFGAHVEEIPDSVVPRRMRPEAPGRPIDVRVLLVKLKLDGPVPMKLGQRVEIRIEADDGPHAAALPH
ncbi:MAG: efflux RND transporter periplasmic adaptor subunit [Myxococcota bacterium]